MIADEEDETRSQDVVESFIARIEAVNESLNCVAARNYDEARALAREADRLVELGERRPLLGVPFTVKESIAVAGMPHTAGLVAREGTVAERDAEVVRLLRLAGAIPLAVTNVSEGAMWWDCSNKVYGRTNNPFDPRRTPGGSSGGEGCLNAAAGTPFGVGSDVGGSVRMPCCFNGIYGHKPTPGIVSNEGQFPPMAPELQDYLCTGPMSRYADDLAPLLELMAGDVEARRLRLDEEVTVSDLKFYYMDGDGAEGRNGVSSVHPDVADSMRSVLKRLRDEWGVVAERLEVPEMRHSFAIWSAAMGGSDSSFSKLLGMRRPVREFFKWLFRLSNYTLPSVAMAALEGGRGDDEKYSAMGQRLRERLEDVLGDDGVLLYPTHPRPAPYHGQPLFMPYNFAYTAVFNVLGFPVTQCPAGESWDGIPLGVQVIAGKYNDRLTLAVARGLGRNSRPHEIAPTPDSLIR